jgi:hypothetical protein
MCFFLLLQSGVLLSLSAKGICPFAAFGSSFYWRGCFAVFELYKVFHSSKNKKNKKIGCLCCSSVLLLVLDQ